MNKYWLLGFIEAGGCFSILIKEAKSTSNQHQISADFSIKASVLEKPVLDEIRVFLGNVGNIYNKNDEVMLKVTKLDEIKKIISILGPMEFVSQLKRKDFENWCRCINLIAEKKHLTHEGLLQIALIRDKMHRKKQWNKQNFCIIKNKIEPCAVYLKNHKIPENCIVCSSR